MTCEPQICAAFKCCWKTQLSGIHMTVEAETFFISHELCLHKNKGAGRGAGCMVVDVSSASQRKGARVSQGH